MASLRSNTTARAYPGFWDKVVQLGDDGCWLWTAAVGTKGYGVYGRPPQLAHRFAYELLVGPIPAGHHRAHISAPRPRPRLERRGWSCRSNMGRRATATAHCVAEEQAP